MHYVIIMRHFGDIWALSCALQRDNCGCRSFLVFARPLFSSASRVLSTSAVNFKSVTRDRPSSRPPHRRTLRITSENRLSEIGLSINSTGRAYVQKGIIRTKVLEIQFTFFSLRLPLRLTKGARRKQFVRCARGEKIFDRLCSGLQNTRASTYKTVVYLSRHL